MRYNRASTALPSPANSGGGGPRALARGPEGGRAISRNNAEVHRAAPLPPTKCEPVLTPIPTFPRYAGEGEGA